MQRHIDFNLEDSIPGSLFLLAVVAAAITLGTVGLVMAAAIGASGRPVMWLVLAVLVAGLAWRITAVIRNNEWPSLLGYVIGLLPVMVVALGTPARHWDDFMTWLPAAEYLRVFAALPVAGGPPTISAFPGYPPGIPVLLASVWSAADRFIPNTGGVLNVASLAVLGGLIVSGGFGSRQTSNLGLLVRAAACTLVATLGNPGIEWEFVLSSLPDVLTAVSIACLAWLAVRFWVAGTAEDRAAVWPAAVFGQILALLLVLRQTGVVLAVILFVAVFAVAIINDGWRKARPWPSQWRGLLLAFAPGLAVVTAWRIYVAFLLPEATEFKLRQIAQWNWSALPSTFSAIGALAVEHWGLSLVMIAVAVYGIRYLNSRWRDTAVEPGRLDDAGALAGVFVILWLLYTGFLVFCYLAAFAQDEALRAAAFIRYQSHVLELGFVVAGILFIRIARRSSATGYEHLRSLALPVCLCLVLVANIFTRPSTTGDFPAVLRYTAGCACAFLPPSKVDDIWAAAEGISDKISANPLDTIVLEFGQSHFKALFVLFVVRFALWQNNPFRLWDVHNVWPGATDAKNRMENASERIQFLTRETGCAVIISRRESGLWVEKARLPAPQCF